MTKRKRYCTWDRGWKAHTKMVIAIISHGVALILGLHKDSPKGVLFAPRSGEHYVRLFHPSSLTSRCISLISGECHTNLVATRRGFSSWPGPTAPALATASGSIEEPPLATGSESGPLIGQWSLFEVAATDSLRILLGAS